MIPLYWDTNDFGGPRLSWYPGNGYVPYTVFGGSLAGNWSNYSQMNSAYNQINNIDSPIDIDMELGIEGTVMSASANITITGDISGYTSPKVVLLISKFTTNSSADYVNRVIAYQNPINLSVSEIGESTIETAEFTLDPDWNLADVNAVCLVQSWTGTKNILQAASTGFTGTMPLMYSNITEGPANLTVNFFDNSLPQGEIESWEWDFDGDGAFDSTEQNPTYTYTEPGVYDITLRIFDGAEYAETTFSEFITVVEPGTPFSGPVCGEWSAANNPYVIDDAIVLEENSDLIINPGTEIILDDSAFKIYGNLTANAEADNRIRFISNSFWSGIRVIGETATAEFSNCLFKNATESAVSIENGPVVTISDCQFTENDADAKAAAIDIINSNDVTIIRNMINNNNSSTGPAAIKCTSASASIYNNIIVNNTAKYSSFSFKNNSTPLVVNNTIANNTAETATMMLFNSTPVFMNNIIRDEIASIININSSPEFTYNNISGGADGIGNIDVDPMFVDIESYMLATGSPCVDAGNPDAEYNDLDGTTNDMGAWGGPNAFTAQPVSADEDWEEIINSNISFYPNPFNLNSSTKSAATISFDKALVGDNSSIEIFNIKGQKVKSFQVEHKINIIWNGKDMNNKILPSGIYFIKLSSSKGNYSSKVMLIK